MLIDIKRDYARQPGSDLLDDGYWYWSATWRNPLHLTSYDDHNYIQASADTPWKAVAALMVMLERVF
jgi:hypothetical protein